MGKSKPMVLCILDGWGYRDNGTDNAIFHARTPNWDRLIETCPHSLLEASESNVGLPAGQMGNSEVGHMNIGAGRVILQDLPRIDQAIQDQTVQQNPALERFIGTLKKTGGTCHLMGLLSPGGVHSHEAHILALANFVALKGIPVAFHAFLDGRDTPPKSALASLERLEGFCKSHPLANIATISGRYYAMDRDKRWDRTQKAYDCLVCPEATATPRASVAADALNSNYQQGITDEFVIPTALGTYEGIKENDGLLMANFRTDRARQILLALLDPQFKEFPRKKFVPLTASLGMVEYSDALNSFMDTLFPTFIPDQVLGEIMVEKGLKQLRIAETEKYAHVTFFFNGGREEPFPGEDRILVPSPKVATYDLKPEMSAFEVTNNLVEAIERTKYDFIVVNYANTDMVGHTGNKEAAIKAVEAVDACLGKLMSAIQKVNGCLVITADHGNAEVMEDHQLNCPHTAHTLNPVPCLIFNSPQEISSLANGKLSDVAPTLLALMGFEVPSIMTGRVLYQ